MENPEFEPSYQTPEAELSNSVRPVSHADERLQALASEVEVRLSLEGSWGIPWDP